MAIKKVYMLDIFAIQPSDGEQLYEEARSFAEFFECANGDAEQYWLDGEMEEHFPSLYAYIREHIGFDTDIIYVKKEW